jgi:hypothetical protein
MAFFNQPTLLDLSDGKRQSRAPSPKPDLRRKSVHRNEGQGQPLLDHNYSFH